MFIGLETCFFYVVVATYVISGCHASNISSTNSSTGLNTTNLSSVGRTTNPTKQSTLAVTPTNTTTVSRNSSKKENTSSKASTKSDKITFPTEQSINKSSDLSPTVATATPLVNGTTETAIPAIYSTTASLSTSTNSSKEVASTAVSSVGRTTNPTTQSKRLSEGTPTYTTTVSRNSSQKENTSSKADKTNSPTKQSIIKSSDLSSTVATATPNESSKTAIPAIDSTTASLPPNRELTSTNSTKEVASTADGETKSTSKNSTCYGAIAKPATFPTEYKVIIIVCLVVVLILLVGCIIERKRCWNVENSKKTRNEVDIEAFPLTLGSTTVTTATNPMYSFGDCIDQLKGAPETSTVDQEPGSKSEMKQADDTHVIEIELHPQSQNQKNTGDQATSSDAVDNTAQSSTSKAEDGRGDSDKDSGKDGGESGTSKPEVASKSECAPKEADVKQVEPSTTPAKDELGPQSQGDTPDNKSNGVQDVVQRSSLGAEVAEAVMEGFDNKNGKDGGEEVSGKPETDAKSECEPAHKTDVEQVDNSTQDVSENGQQPQLREINLAGDITIKEMKLF